MFVIDTNFIVNERIEVERLSILEIHLRFAHFPPIKVRSRRSEKYGMYSASRIGASVARWIRISRAYGAGLVDGSGKVISQVGTL